jgi:plasmid stabilization system protein ParE
MVAGGFEVRLSLRAFSDLDNISANVAQHSPAVAEAIVSQLYAAFKDLKFMPERFQSVGRSRKRNNNVHARVVAPYLIYYRIDLSARIVSILEVRHGARKRPRY